jgi:hypothetical protein
MARGRSYFYCLLRHGITKAEDLSQREKEKRSERSETKREGLACVPVDSAQSSSWLIEPLRSAATAMKGK